MHQFAARFLSVSLLYRYSITLTCFLSQLIRPHIGAALATGPTHKPQAGANLHNHYYLRFGRDFGDAGGGDKSTGVNCCASQASKITDWRVPL